MKNEFCFFKFFSVVCVMIGYSNKSLASARMADRSFLEHPLILYGTTYNLTPPFGRVQGIEF